MAEMFNIFRGLVFLLLSQAYQSPKIWSDLQYILYMVQTWPLLNNICLFYLLPPLILVHYCFISCINSLLVWFINFNQVYFFGHNESESILCPSLKRSWNVCQAASSEHLVHKFPRVWDIDYDIHIVIWWIIFVKALKLYMYVWSQSYKRNSILSLYMELLSHVKLTALLDSTLIIVVITWLLARSR